MSDALEYLIKVRGNALGHSTKFLKDAGKHLNPKTRDRISVITKIDAQTKPGFRQYLCPHQVTNIPHLALDGLTLTCRKHHWKFDISTGACIEKGQAPAQGVSDPD